MTRSEQKPNLGRHKRNCSVCRHPKLSEIEADFISWRSPAAITLWKDWYHQCRRPELIVINHIRGFDHPRPARLLFPGVEVPVETRKITAGDFQPQLVPGQKHIARRPEIHRDVISLSRVRQLRFLLRIPVAQPQDSARQVLRKTI